MAHIKQIKELLPSIINESYSLLVCALDLEGEVIHSNARFMDFFRLGSVSGSFFLELFNDFQKEELETLLSELIGKPNDVIGYSQNYFNKLLTWEFSVLKNAEGDFLGILASCSVKDESEYLFNELGFRVSIESDIYFQMNNEWEILHANSNAESFFGTSASGFVDKKIWQVFPDPKIYEYALHLKKAKETNSITVIEDYLAESGRCYKLIIHPRMDRMDIYFKDVSEFQLLSNEIGRLDLTLDSILNNTDQSYILMSQDLRILRFNNIASSQLKEYSGKELKDGQKFLQFLLPGLEEKVISMLEQIIGGKQISFEYPINNGDNSEPRLFKHEFFPVMNSNKKVIGIVYSNKDIHDSHSLFSRLQDQNSVLKEILFSQSFVLRSPLSSMIGLLELLDKKQLDKENQTYLAYLKVLADELDQIIRKNTKTINDSDSF